MMDTEKVTPLCAFFDQYEGFKYKQGKTAEKQFEALGKYLSWSPDDAGRREAREQFYEALVQEFKVKYGANKDDLKTWQALYSALGIIDVPSTAELCRKEIRFVHVNLIDLLDHDPSSKTRITLFDSEKELSKYTKKHKKYFPRKYIHAGDLLKCFQRQIVRPRKEKQRKPGKDLPQGLLCSSGETACTVEFVQEKLAIISV